MSTFTAAAIIPAYEDIALDLGTSLQRVSYLTSLQIAILGGAPLFWRPLSTRYGRRPIFLISLIGAALFNIGCARTNTYGTMATCRAFAAFFICPASAIGSAVVVETFFKQERAKYMGIWTVMITLGVPLAPFIMGFVAYHVGYRWIYWIIAMVLLSPLSIFFYKSLTCIDQRRRIRPLHLPRPRNSLHPSRRSAYGSSAQRILFQISPHRYHALYGL